MFQVFFKDAIFAADVFLQHFSEDLLLRFIHGLLPT